MIKRKNLLKKLKKKIKKQKFYTRKLKSTEIKNYQKKPLKNVKNLSSVFLQ